LGENAEFARTSQEESEAIEVVDDLFDTPVQP